MKVYINSIRFNRSLVDGPGVRTVIFFKGVIFTVKVARIRRLGTCRKEHLAKQTILLIF